MPTSNLLRSAVARVLTRIPARFFIRALSALTIALFAAFASAASIRGVVTDATGAKVAGATISLVSKGKVVATAVSSADGSFQILSGAGGHFFLVISAKTFRQLQTPDFYAGKFDSVERNLVLEPEWVHESIVVTATGTPTPQPQTSAATTVLGPLDLALRESLVSDLRVIPGAFAVQSGQRGSQTSLFVRGGDSDDNKILIDGIDAGDLGGRFDFGTLSTTGVESAEIYRGPNSSLYGAGADSSVVSLTTSHGTTSFPSLLFEGDAGSFNTSREQFTLAGAHNKLDYLGAASWLQTANNLPRDESHLATGAANIGLSLNASTQIRGTLHYGVASTGVPNAWDFHYVADDATQKDQDLFASGSIDNQTTPGFHQSARYGLTRKRQQYQLWQQEGSGIVDAYGDSFGFPVTIHGANGYSATGAALLDFPGPYPERQLVSNRDALVYHGDLTITPHLAALVGFQFENERGADPHGFYPSVERSNYDYIAAVHGDFQTRFFYSLGGSLEHYSLFGTQTTPRAGVSCYIFRPHSGVFSGTRVLFNFGDAVREPDLTDQFYSLYNFLLTAPGGGPSTIQQYNITPLAAPHVRTYEGGAEQYFLSQRIIFRTSFFHNEFGRQIEYVGYHLVPQLLPNLSQQLQHDLEAQLNQDGAYELSINSEAFRALGVETSVESGIGRNIFLRGGYTYLDAVVQRSFTNDDVALLGPIPTYNNVPNGIPIGSDSPLQGARPFRRAPHTGYFTATYSAKRFTGVFTSAFASRSDDSDFLAYDDVNGRSSLLLPNRNLDFGYAKLDIGGSYRLFNWMDVYAQAENLTNNEHIAPIGFQSLPFNLRTGLRLRWGPGSGH